MKPQTSRPTPAAEPQLVYKISSAMAKLDCSRATIYRLIARGDLTKIKLGARGTRITCESVERLAAKGSLEN